MVFSFHLSLTIFLKSSLYLSFSYLAFQVAVLPWALVMSSCSLHSVLIRALAWFFSYTPSWSWPSFCGVGPLLPPLFPAICMFQLGPGLVSFGCHSVGFPQLKLSCLSWMMPLHTCLIQISFWCHLIHFSLCWLVQLVGCHWFHTASGHLHRMVGWSWSVHPVSIHILSFGVLGWED